MSAPPDRRIAILGATGPTGWHLARILAEHGATPRVVSRSADRLAHRFGERPFERVAADVLDLEAARRAVAGRDLVFDCIGLPGDLMHLHPTIARNVARAVREAGARCVQISSFWSYLPVVHLPLDEHHPRRGGGPWVRYRREAEDILRDAGAVVLHLPDFYGPGVHTSVLQQPLIDAVRGRAMSWIGAASTRHEYVFVPDAMRIAVRVAGRDDAPGRRFVLGGAGPIDGRRVADIAGTALGRKVKLRAAGAWTLRFVSLFRRDLRPFLQMVPDYLEPITYDTSRLRALIGDLPATPYEDGIRQTLASIRGSEAAR